MENKHLIRETVQKAALTASLQHLQFLQRKLQESKDMLETAKAVGGVYHAVPEEVVAESTNAIRDYEESLANEVTWRQSGSQQPGTRKVILSHIKSLYLRIWSIMSLDFRREWVQARADAVLDYNSTPKHNPLLKLIAAYEGHEKTWEALGLNEEDAYRMLDDLSKQINDSEDAHPTRLGF